jgi:predicted XRE-type DNA-binding protein
MPVSHVTPADGNVFADLGFPPAEAENLKVRSSLMIAVQKIIVERRLTQTAAAKVFGVSRQTISELRHGKIDAFTIDSLVNMLAHAGIHLELTVRDAA